MIKLTRPDKPKQLTESVKQKLTNDFITSNKRKNVWGKPYIKDTLLMMSHSKCCYCECTVNVDGRYMTVDHYHDKNTHPDEVVDWENLLPACSYCNSNKGSHDTYDEPIVNPTLDNPQDYFYTKDSRYRCKKNINRAIAHRTIQCLNLNDMERLVNPRLMIVNEVNSKLENYEAKLSGVLDSTTLFSIRNGVKNILTKAQPDKEYSAIVATAIINDEEYNDIIDFLKTHKLWSDELEQLHKSADAIKLDTQPY